MKALRVENLSVFFLRIYSNEDILRIDNRTGRSTVQDLQSRADDVALWFAPDDSEAKLLIFNQCSLIAARREIIHVDEFESGE